MTAGETFGITNGVITMLSLITGLYSTNVNKIGIMGAIMSLLIVDPLSDAYSLYVSQQKLTNKESAYDISKKAFLLQAIIQFIFLMIIYLTSTVKQGLIVSYVTGIMLILGNGQNIYNLMIIFALVVLTLFSG